MSPDVKARRLAVNIVKTHRNKYRKMVKRVGVDNAAWYAKLHGIVIK